MNDKLFRMIGLAYRAGSAKTGEARAAESIKEKRARLVVLSKDAAQNTAKKIEGLCKNHGVLLICAGSRDELGHYTGREFAVVVAIEDEGFAQAIEKTVKER